MKFNGLIRSKEDLANEFDIHTDIMKYNSLISAIPSKWKQCVKNISISCHTSPADGEIIVKLSKGNKNVLSTQCKYYYKEFVNIKYERPTALNRWEEMYYNADFDWPVLFKIPYKVARETDVGYKVCNSR